MKKSGTNKENLTKLHKEKLGMDIPDGFFAESKEDILNLVEKEKNPKPKVVWLRPLIAYPVAAALVIALAITFWLKNDNEKINEQVVDTEDINLLNFDLYEDDFLLSSLMIEDKDMDEFIDDYIITEIIVEADRQERQIDDLIINSLFVEDSLIDGYLDENLIENIML